MRVTVRLFARLKDLAATGELVREVPAGSSVADIWRGMVAEHPGLAPTARRCPQPSTLSMRK